MLQEQGILENICFYNSDDEFSMIFVEKQGVILPVGTSSRLTGMASTEAATAKTEKVEENFMIVS